MRRSLIHLVLIAGTLLGSAAHLCAQDLNITAVADPTEASVGENIRLVVTIEGNANISSAPVLPDLTDFQVYSGGRSSNFSFVNGQVSSSLNFTYILVPKREGTLTLGPVQITHENKVYTTQPITLTIGRRAGAAPGSSAPNPPAAAPGAGTTVPVPRGHQNDAVFITTSVDRREVMVNEPITLTFRFFSRVPILSQPQYQPADTSGFWAEDLPPQREYVTSLNGREYRVIEIKSALFPTTAGKLSIGSAQLTVQVQDLERRGADPFDDSFFRDFFSRGEAVRLGTQPISILVRPLPSAGQPADFSGTVGQWSLAAKLDRRSVKVGEAVTLEVRIFGDGNVKSVGKPKLPDLPGFRVYETVSSSEVQKQNARVRGVKIYRTLIRPEVTGELTVPSLSYTYFDTSARKFVRLQVPALNLTVQPGDAATTAALSAAGAGITATNAPGVKLMTQDIRYLKTGEDLYQSPRSWPAGWWIIGFGLPPLGLLGYWLWQRRQEQLASDPRFARRLNAERSARQALRSAQACRQRKDAKGFYAALAQALVHYLADRLGWSRAGIKQRDLLLKLKDLGAPADALGRLSAILEACDFGRFAPGEPELGELEKLEDQAAELLTLLGRVVKERRT